MSAKSLNAEIRLAGWHVGSVPILFQKLLMASAKSDSVALTRSAAGAVDDGLAGVWENWKDPASGEWIRTFAVVTTDGNSLVAEIHERMPVPVRTNAHVADLGRACAALK
jgi:hypothetical protein